MISGASATRQWVLMRDLGAIFFPEAMTQEEFDARMSFVGDQAKAITESWCFVVRCPAPGCDSMNCWYEGVLSTLLARVNEPCRKCGRLEGRTVDLGIGESYEL